MAKSVLGSDTLPKAGRVNEGMSILFFSLLLYICHSNPFIFSQKKKNLFQFVVNGWYMKMVLLPIGYKMKKVSFYLFYYIQTHIVYT